MKYIVIFVIGMGQGALCLDWIRDKQVIIARKRLELKDVKAKVKRRTV